MQKKVLVTPYFIDEDRSPFRDIMEDGWAWNDGQLDTSSDNQQIRVRPVHQNIADFVAETAGNGDMPISLAGDCVATIPVIAGLQRANIDPLFIWFDSHGDFNTWETTPSEFLGGMPLAMIAGLGELTMMEALGAKPLAGGDIVLTDGRDLDAGEDDLVANSGLLHLLDPADLLTADLPDKPIYLHFDSDVMRLSDTPAVSYKAEGGPEMETLRQVLVHLRESGRLAAVSATLWNPNLDGAEQSRENVMSLLRELL